MVATAVPTIGECLAALASVDQDFAREQNGIGFNRIDGDFGRKLIAVGEDRWSPKQKRAAYVMARKYRGQLSAVFGIDFDRVPEVPPVTDEVQAAYDAERARARGYTPGVPTNARRIAAENDNNNGDGIAITFGYDAELVQATKAAFMGRLRWKTNGPRKYWRLAIPAVPEEARTILAFAEAHDFQIDPELRTRIALIAESGDARRQASRAATSDYTPPELLRQLYPFQRAGVDYVVNHAGGRAMIGDEMGLGKSIQSIASVHALAAYPCLMITKATTKYAMRNEWIATIPGMKPADVYIVGSKIDTEAYRAASVVIVNWDLVMRHLDTLLAGRGEPWGALIVDESHRAKSHNAQRTEAVKALATGRRQKKNESGRGVKQQGRKIYETVATPIPAVICLTGTPAPNGRASEWIAQLEIMRRLDDMGGFWKFRQKYCNLETDAYGHDKEGEAEPTILHELNDRLRAVCYVARRKADVLPELPPITRQILPVDMPASVRAEYRRAEKDIITFAGEQATKAAKFRESIAGLPADEQERAIKEYRNTAEARAARAAAIVKLGTLKRIAGLGKIDAAKDWIADFAESGDKLIVFAHHVDVQRAILAEHPEAVHILGSDAPEARQDAVQRFQNDPAVKMIVCATEAASEGVTLTAASNVLFLELEWVPTAHDQAEARCYGRVNDAHGANAYYLLAEDSIDTYMWELLETKRTAIGAMVDGANPEAGRSIAGDVFSLYTGKAAK